MHVQDVTHSLSINGGAHLSTGQLVSCSGIHSALDVMTDQGGANRKHSAGTHHVHSQCSRMFFYRTIIGFVIIIFLSGWAKQHKQDIQMLSTKRLKPIIKRIYISFPLPLFCCFSLKVILYSQLGHLQYINNKRFLFLTRNTGLTTAACWR